MERVAIVLRSWRAYARFVQLLNKKLFINFCEWREGQPRTSRSTEKSVSSKIVGVLVLIVYGYYYSFVCKSVQHPVTDGHLSYYYSKIM